MLKEGRRKEGRKEERRLSYSSATNEELDKIPRPLRVQVIYVNIDRCVKMFTSLGYPKFCMYD